MMKSHVYALRDPRTGLRRYVGKHDGVDLSRVKAHAQPSSIKKDLEGSNPRKGRWLTSLPQRGAELPYDFEILQWYDTVQGAADDEERWIQKLRAEGAPLLNLAKGGRSPMSGREFSAETRAKLSEARKRYLADPVTKEKWAEGNRIRRRTPEAREKTSQIMKRVWEDPAQQAKRSDAMIRHFKEDPDARLRHTRGLIGRVVSSEQRAKISQSLMGHSVSPETRSKMSEAAQKRWTDARRQEESERQKKRMENPVEYAKIVEAQRRRREREALAKSKVLTK